MANSKDMSKKINVFLAILFGLLFLSTFFLIKPIQNTKLLKESEKIEEDLFIKGAVSVSRKILFNNKKKIVVEQRVDLVGSLANISIVVRDDRGNLIPNLLVMVYDEMFSPIYGYSILRSDSLGKVDFVLNKDKKFFIVISTEKKQYGVKPPLYFIAQLELDTFKNKKITTNLSLFEVGLFFKNWSRYFSELPDVKLEAVVVNDLGESESFEYASNSDGKKDRINFFVSKGVYRFNVDTMDFDYRKPLSIIAQTNQVSVPKINQVDVDLSLFERYVQKSGDMGYGWVKYQNPISFYGDHQSPFFPENDTFLISNLKKIKQSMVYIPLEKCVERMLVDHPDALQSLNLCTNTDIRFDFSNILNLNRDEISISAPEKLLLYPDKTEVVEGDDLKIDYHVLNGSGAEILSIYIHQLWDSQILPQFFFYDENGLLVHRKDLFDENYVPYRYPHFEEKICLEEGKYSVEAKLPTPLWGEKRELTNSFELVVSKGEGCHYQDKQDKDQYFQYKSWQQLYGDREALFKKSSGYLLTLPNFSSSRLVEINDGKEQITINSCEDFQLANQAEVVWINITPDLVFDKNEHGSFSKCLAVFSQNNPAKDYVLINNYWEDKPYPTSNLYIMYYFYRLIHQGSGAEVGVLATKFYDFFYGFPDFIVTNPQSLRIVGEDEDAKFKSTLIRWLQNYGDLSPEKIIFASPTW